MNKWLTDQIKALLFEWTAITITCAFTLAITSCSQRAVPIATPTIAPTITPSETPIPPTKVPSPTVAATKVLSPQEQLEREFGHLVPADEKCVGEGQEDIILSSDDTQTSIHYAHLRVHAADPSNAIKETVLLGPPQDRKPVEVLSIPVVCRDINGNIIKPQKLVLGGTTFGKNGADVNIFFDLMGPHGVPVQTILDNIKEGDLIDIFIAIKPGQGNIHNAPSYYGESNFLTKTVLSMLKNDSTFFDAVNLLAQNLAQGSADLPSDFLLLPSRIELASSFADATPSN